MVIFILVTAIHKYNRQCFYWRYFNNSQHTTNTYQVSVFSNVNRNIVEVTLFILTSGDDQNRGKNTLSFIKRVIFLNLHFVQCLLGY